MTGLDLHRNALIMVAVALLLLAAGLPLIGMGQDEATHRALALSTEIAKVKAETGQLEANIVAAQELAGRIDPAEVTRLLAPVDRLQAAALLDKEAAQRHLTHFTYMMGPERKETGPLTGEATNALVTSRIDLTAEAPSDTDVYVFLDAIQHGLPGRLTLTQLSLQRGGSSDAAPTAVNLHMEAHLDWLSNGAARTVQDGY